MFIMLRNSKDKNDQTQVECCCCWNARKVKKKKNENDDKEEASHFVSIVIFTIVLCFFSFSS